MSYLKSSLVFVFSMAVSAAAISNPIYIIRNAERPSLGGAGLTEVGYKRATTCIKDLFSQPAYNIGLIVACARADAEGAIACHAAQGTAVPLADTLGLTVEEPCRVSDTSSYAERLEQDQGVDECMSARFEAFAQTSSKSILVVWDEDHVDGLIDSLDINGDKPQFPAGYADVVFSVQNGELLSKTSQNCSTIDTAQSYPVPGLWSSLVKKRSKVSRQVTSRSTERIAARNANTETTSKMRKRQVPVESDGSDDEGPETEGPDSADEPDSTDGEGSGSDDEGPETEDPDSADEPDSTTDGETDAEPPVKRSEVAARQVLSSSVKLETRGAARAPAEARGIRGIGLKKRQVVVGSDGSDDEGPETEDADSADGPSSDEETTGDLLPIKKRFFSTLANRTPEQSYTNAKRHHSLRMRRIHRRVADPE